MTALNAAPAAHCRFCRAELRDVFVDLGMSPLCQKHVNPDELNCMERFYPLKVWVCRNCWLVQLEEYVAPKELFEHYEYLSSYSTSWVEHARKYAELMTARLGLGAQSRVVEIASNDGYLLQHFVAKGIPVLGIEPAANVAELANSRGVRSVAKFFGVRTAEEVAGDFGRADLIVGNNVLAHVPDLHDFVGGMSRLLGERGVITMEFPHLVRLVEENQFDTIYHEHFSYLSLLVVEQIFRHHGLEVFDVSELPTHGGSLRIFAHHVSDSSRSRTDAVRELIQREHDKGYAGMDVYRSFEARVLETKRKLLEFLIGAKRAGKSVAGYGAPGKGNTLLNYCGIRTDFLDYTVDASPLKQGRYTPGTHIPILDPAQIRATRPDYVLILPWNLRREIAAQAQYIREWGGQFVVPIPALEVF